MEKKNKCSFKEHKEIDAISYCQKCKIFMCKKCIVHHIGLFEDHNQFNLDNDTKEIFTGFCKEIKHFNELEFFCKTHNQLCCIACISKIKSQDYGQHSECDVCPLEKIKDAKINKLYENIKTIKDLSINIEKSITELKNLFEKIKENKEEIKLYILNIFTKIRNAINQREDEILLEIDNLYENTFCNENLVKETEKLPQKIKMSIEKEKMFSEKLKTSKLNSIINDCINLENNIKEINFINENIGKAKTNKLEIKFTPENDDLNKFLDEIKKFGKIQNIRNEINEINELNIIYKFKECPLQIKKKRKYSLSGKNNNILTKIGSNFWMGAICENVLKNPIEYKWKIKILKSSPFKNIMIGVSPIDININKFSYKTSGWYLNCSNSNLFSGPPFNYTNKSIGLKKVKDEVIVIMNMKNKTLKFIIDNEDKGECYSDIPLDKEISPAVFLSDTNDSVEIIGC